MFSEDNTKCQTFEKLTTILFFLYKKLGQFNLMQCSQGVLVWGLGEQRFAIYGGGGSKRLIKKISADILYQKHS